MADIRIQKLRDSNIAKVFFGAPNAVDQLLIGLIGRGHVLVEDVPGVGKTVLAKTLAKSIDCKFSRIQLTPDMLPSDVLGVSIYDNATKTFDFKPGPIFANIVLADEINRTTPRTQSALLEAMSEEQVSFENQTFPLKRPFMVIATQNPFEFEGTYYLPENQLDRFPHPRRRGLPHARIRIAHPHRATFPHHARFTHPRHDRRRCRRPPGHGPQGQTRQRPSLITSWTSSTPPATTKSFTWASPRAARWH